MSLNKIPESNDLASIAVLVQGQWLSIKILCSLKIYQEKLHCDIELERSTIIRGNPGVEGETTPTFNSEGDTIYSSPANFEERPKEGQQIFSRESIKTFFASF